MHYPTKAIVLAAGLGTRLRPLSLDLPKPLMPFWGRPLLELALEMLSAWGVREVLINLHHQADSILQYLRQRSAAGQSPLRICLSFEPTILGTGGALQRAGWFLDRAPFWIINADIVADLDPVPLLEAFAEPRTLAALWLHPTRGPRSVEMRRGLISTFNSRRPGTAGTYTFCGLHLVSPAIGRYLPAGSSSIIAAYALALAARRRLRGVCLPGSYWADVGTPASYLEAHAEAWQGLQQGLPRGRLVSAAAQQRQRAWQGRGVRIQGFAAIGTGVRIAKGARLSQAVLWDGARIASAAHIERAIIGRRTDVRGRVTRLAMRADLILPPAQRSADPQLALALARLRWDPAKVSVIPFAARGSERVFTRLKCAKTSAIMISYSTQRRENTLYAAQTRFLQSLPWPVPAILVDMPAQQFLVVEDLGDRSLQHLAQSARPATLERYYRLVLSSLYQLHQRGASAARRRQLELMAPFTAEVYRWERELFAHHFLERRLGLAPARIQGILRELAGVAQALLRAPLVLVHRDFQASNIILRAGQPYIIDFQGMRLGAAAYDLAALLCDPYVELALPQQLRWLDLYNQLAGRSAINRELFWLAAVERLVQALGAFGRLGAQPETARFEQYIPAALRQLQRALRQVDLRPELLRAVETAIDKYSRDQDNAPK